MATFISPPATKAAVPIVLTANAIKPIPVKLVGVVIAAPNVTPSGGSSPVIPAGYPIG
jgi:hypothetical protein